MAFQTIPGFEGQVFVPDEGPGERKHPCRECYACQQCSDDRCRVCRSDDPATSPPGFSKIHCRRCAETGSPP